MHRKRIPVTIATQTARGALTMTPHNITPRNCAQQITRHRMLATERRGTLCNATTLNSQQTLRRIVLRFSGAVIVCHAMNVQDITAHAMQSVMNELHPTTCHHQRAPAMAFGATGDTPGVLPNDSVNDSLNDTQTTHRTVLLASHQ